MDIGSLYSPAPKRTDDSESEKLQDMSRANGVLIGLVIVTLKVFADHGNFSITGKRLFNFIITTLSLILGFNFFEAFKDMAKVLRWRVLANRESSIREMDLILGCENLKNQILLIRESRKKSLIVLVCIGWIVLNILAQTSIAAIELTYSLDNGKDSSGIVTKPGIVTVAKLDCYYNNDTCATGPYSPPEMAQDLAHTYGENIRVRQMCSYTIDSDIQAAPQDCYYFNNVNAREFAIRYAEFSPNDPAHAYPYFTDRVVKASAGECVQYNIDEEASFNINSIDGGQDVRFQHAMEELNSTTYIYIYNGLLPPQNTTSQSCGTQCLWLYAWQNKNPKTQRSMLLFQCPISISAVSNITHDRQNLPDLNAGLAAASIALTGRYTNPNGSKEKIWQQYRVYPSGSYWESQNLPADAVGARMFEFAIGSLAVMADLNPKTSGQGKVPILGYNVSVTWVRLIPLVAAVAGVHFILIVLMLWTARLVVVPNDSHLCMAHLLQGLAGRLGGIGSLLDAKEMAEAIGSQGTGQVMYGIRDMEEQGEGRVLELRENVKVQNKRKSFPVGCIPNF